MSKSEEFLDLIENHHYKVDFEDDNMQNFCLLGAANKVYGMNKSENGYQDCFTHLKTMDSIIIDLFPDVKKSMNHPMTNVTPHFNDHYGTKEDIMLVAKHFVNKIDTIKQ